MSNEYKPTYVDNTDNSISIMESTDTISFCKTGTKINTLSAKNVAHKKTGENLNLCAYDGSNFNPVITINNNHSDCRIMTNLNVNGNVNITNNLIIPTHSKTSNLLANIQGSIYYNTSENMYEGYSQTEGWQPLGGFSKTKDAIIHKNLNVIGNINLTNEGMIKTTGIGSFGSITTTGSITSTTGSITTNNQDINAGSGTVTANTFSGTATKVEITNHNTDGSNHYIPLTLGTGLGNYQLYGDNNLYYNPSSNTLYAGTFDGTFNGTASDSNKLNGYASSTSNSANYIVRRDSNSDIRANYGRFYNITVATTAQVSNLNATYVGGNQYSSSWGAVTASNSVNFSNKKFSDSVSIGHTGAPVQTLHVSGTAAVSNWLIVGATSWNTNNGGGYTLSVHGESYLRDSYASSDDRLKKDEELLENVTATLLKLRPQKYKKYNDLNEQTEFKIESGLIAQEIYYEVPELRHIVRPPSDATLTNNYSNVNFSDIKNDPNYDDWGTTPAAVSYNGLISYLIKGFQEQNTIINTQQNEINTLKTENAELKSIIDKLKTANSFEEFKNSL